MTKTKTAGQGPVEASLVPLFERAEREGLWFRHTYYGDDVFLSPAELRKAQADGSWNHGAVNWALEDPRERLKRMDANILRTKQTRDIFAARIGDKA